MFNGKDKPICAFFSVLAGIYLFELFICKFNFNLFLRTKRKSENQRRLNDQNRSKQIPDKSPICA